MHFTREPIIETVVTPREGCKLVVRSSKASGQEEYHVEAVEVVSFGRSFFFRSTEKPRAFLLPVSDYEVVELKDTRMVLKNAPAERSIKIGGGRDAPPRPQREREPQAQTEGEEQPAGEQSQAQPQDSPQNSHGNNDRRGGRRRRGRRGRDRDRGGDQFHHDQRPQQHAPQPTAEGSEMIDEGAPLSEEAKAPSFISKLFPPPPTLIKETLGRYKHPESAEEGTPPASNGLENGARDEGDEHAEPPFDE